MTTIPPFLSRLIQTPSPPGCEQEIQSLVADEMKRYADDIRTDVHGNLILALNEEAHFRVMIAGHCDQIGFMVKHISRDGYIYFSPLAGIDAGVLQGARVVIHGSNGPVRGVIGRKPIHLQSLDEREKGRVSIENMWIDIGARSSKEASKRVEIGDSATFELDPTLLSNGLITSAGLDDKVGLYVALETFKRCSKAKINVALYVASTVQEEMHHRGVTTSAFAIDPHVGIVVDVTHASDNPGNDNPKQPSVALHGGPCISKGPSTNPVLSKRLIEVAKKEKLPHQILPNPKLASNDAAALQVTRAGVATAVLGIPNRYMHTQVEIVSLTDLETSIQLLTAFVRGLPTRTSFFPSHLRN